MLAKWMLRCTEKIGENEHAFTFIGLFFTGSAILARCAGLFWATRAEDGVLKSIYGTQFLKLC